jgi:hypothetical protein
MTTASQGSASHTAEAFADKIFRAALGTMERPSTSTSATASAGSMRWRRRRRLQLSLPSALTPSRDMRSSGWR